MSIFESSNRHFPKSWSEASLDFKGMFFYFGCVSLLWIFGRSLSVKTILLLVILFVAIWITISDYNRKQRKWQWIGASKKNIFESLLALLLGGIFMFATSSVWSFTDAPAWYIGACSIFIFNALHYLNLIDLSEQDFHDNCNGNIHIISKNRSNPPVTNTTEWKNKIKTIYNIFFIVVWVEFMIFAYYINTSYNNGAPAQTSNQTEELSQHGRTVYVTSSEKTVVNILETFALIGIPSALFTGFFLQKKGILPETNRKKTNSGIRQKKRG